MRIVRTHADNRFRTQRKFLRPGGGQLPGDRVGRPGFRSQRIAEGNERRVKFFQEFPGRVAAPLLVPHHLVAGCTAAPLYFFRMDRAGQFGGYPVAVFHRRKRGFLYRRIFPQGVEDFRPEPFRGVHSARVLRKVGAAPTPREVVDFVGFADGCVIFPEDEHGVRVFREFGKKRERCSGRVRENRG